MMMSDGEKNFRKTTSIIMQSPSLSRIPLQNTSKVRKNSENLTHIHGNFIFQRQNKTQALLNVSDSCQYPIYMQIPHFTIKDSLYSLQQILISIRFRMDYIQNEQIPLDKFFVGSAGNIIFQNQKVKKGINIKQNKEVLWVHRLMERMNYFTNDSFNDFYLFYQRAHEKACVDIDYFCKLIKSYCQCMKIILPSKITNVNQRNKVKTETSRRKVKKADNENDEIDKKEKKSQGTDFWKLSKFSSNSVPKFLNTTKCSRKLQNSLAHKNKSLGKSGSTTNPYSLSTDCKDRTKVKQSSTTTNITQSQQLDCGKASAFQDPNICSIFFNQSKSTNKNFLDFDTPIKKQKFDGNVEIQSGKFFTTDRMDLLSEVESQEEESESHLTPRTSNKEAMTEIKLVEENQKIEQQRWRSKAEKLFLENNSSDLQISINDDLSDNQYPEQSSPFIRKLKLLARPIESSRIQKNE